MSQRLNRVLESTYGVTYAGTYARCIDAGLSPGDAESSIRGLIVELENNITLSKHSSKVESIIQATVSSR